MKTDRFRRQCESPTCPYRKRLWRAWLEPQGGLSLDGRWYCSPVCFQGALVTAIEQLLPVAARPQTKPHRVPLGLLMLSRGYVDNEQLKKALKAQKDSGSGRVGEWLRHIGAATEEQVTKVLGVQWSIPVFPLNQTRRYLECADLVPFPLLQVAEMVPVHYLPANQLLYLAFVDRINYTALYSVEKMLECHTEPCLALQSHVQQAFEELQSKHLSVEAVIDNLSGPGEMATLIFSYAARVGANQVRVSGFSGFIWTRFLSPSGMSDLLFRVRRDQPELDIHPAAQE